MLRVLVLGAAAGGGFPQWNCNRESCRRARQRDPNATPQTQSSLAVSADGENWYLLNASPDLRQQIFDTPQLHPKNGTRHSPIAGVVLTNCDVDHIAGLLTMRESSAFALYATRKVLGVLAGNSIFGVLNPDFVKRREFRLDQPFEAVTADGRLSGIEIEAFAVPGKVALYLENGTAENNFGSEKEDTVGLRVASKSDGRHFYYIPGCAALDAPLAARLQAAPLVFFDGTLWRDDEMIAAGTGVNKTGQRMGHMSMSGPDGAIAAFESLDVQRKLFIHINNTNPVLISDSEESRVVRESDWELARDGMEINL